MPHMLINTASVSSLSDAIWENKQNSWEIAKVIGHVSYSALGYADDVGLLTPSV